MNNEGSAKNNQPSSEDSVASNSDKTKKQKIRPFTIVLGLVGLILVGGLYMKLNSDAKVEAMIEVHNTMVGLNNAYAQEIAAVQNQNPDSIIDAFNAIDEIFEKAAGACSQFHSELKAMDLSKCPKDYQVVFNKLIKLLEEEQQALSDKKIGRFIEIASKRKALMEEFNMVARRYDVFSM